MALQDNYKKIIDILSSDLFESERKIAHGNLNNENIEDTNENLFTDGLIHELAAQAILPVALPTHNATSAVIAANIRVAYEHTELHELLTENNIPYVSLKGVASASYYPNPVLRTMGDVDFLIREKDFPRASALLEESGFTPEENRGGIHVGFHRDNSTWEMHRSVNGIPEGTAGEKVEEYLSDIIETAVDYDEGNGIVKVPDAFHHGLVMLLHTASHLTSEGVGLRHLCDWAVFVNHFTDDQFRFLFENKLKACGLWRFAQLLSLVSVKYLNLPYGQWMGDADADILEQLITDIMEGGNFGKKDQDRYRQIKYISNRGEHTVDQKSTVRQLWDTIGKKAKDTNTSRISVIADYARMVVSGERKLDNKATVKNAAKRKNLYAEFHLFEKTE